ncbi:Glycosyl transferase family 2 [Sulfitobacter noctilucicola]|uniref:Glycosyl transferase family 2 n=1 Tax=Sulfitobacter noctilucicola TaxID=1342301 RepID=A0A7W6M9T0_9RHOB|nr:glycosyltransferase family 2 protein [Sulfitobacter noctilucicola]KIN63383.1 Glycosyl transferase family 2 [Sulfitobacter noctilucicola]MBB4175099.1 hypothetical protein [Sulfitobacter noctilucicola]
MLTVGAILREPLVDTLRFVDWYQEQGADQVILCFDDTDDPAIEALAHREGVRCIPCTHKFWRQIGINPGARFTKRQNAAMQFVYDRSPVGWFLNVDGDEFVHLEGRNLKEEVSRQPKDVNAFIIRPVERIRCPHSPDYLQFRMPMPRWRCKAIYGDFSQAMRKRQGLAGHWYGKSVTRTGLIKHTMRQHFMQTPEGDHLTDVTLGPEQGAYLLHFVDQGFEAWRSKLEWRLSSRGFRPEMAAFINAALVSAEPEKALRAIHDALFVFDAPRISKLEEAGASFRVDLRENEKFRGYFSGELVYA